MNIAALRVCYRFATLPRRCPDHDVSVGDLAVVMGWSPQHARLEMEKLVVERMLAGTEHRDWYTVTDDGARTLMEDEARRDAALEERT